MKKSPVKNIYLLLSVILVLPVLNPAFANESRENKQARLDSACEIVREKKLVPVRKRLVEECIANKEFPSRKECATFYADYGARMGGRAPLFYDLPECVTAFEYNQSSRNRD